MKPAKHKLLLLLVSCLAIWGMFSFPAHAAAAGDPELAAVWKDPDFDPSVRAFYYARVIEIPTPRWTAYDQVRFGIKMSDEVPMTEQQRAWTSPIWYTP